MRNYVFIYKTSVDTWLTFQKLKKYLTKKITTITSLSIDLEDEDAVLRIESSERNEEHILILLHACDCEGSIMGVFECGRSTKDEIAELIQHEYSQS